MYRQVSRSGRGLKSPSRARSPSPAARSTSPTRNLSQLSHSVHQAPIIPRYRPGGDLLQVPAYLASHYNSPIIPNAPVSPMMTPTATGATMTPTSISPKMKPVSPKVNPVTPTATGLPTSISPKMKPISPKVKPVITPVMSTKIPSPKRTPVSPKVTPIPPITATPIIPTILPYTISHYTDIPVPSPITAPTTVHPPFPLSHYTDIPVPSPITAPTTVHPAYPLPHYTDMPVPSPITAPATVHTPFPLPHYTDMPIPSPITAPSTVHTPFPLPHYTGYPVPSPITAPIGLPQPPYPLPHFTDIPISSPVNPSGSHIPHPTSTPGMPWWVMAIGIGVATGIAIVVAKERGETIVLPRMSIPSISIPEAALLTMATSEVGMGTESVLKSVSDKVSTTIVPPVKSFLQILFSWVGMCGTFVFFCFVAVIRAKLFASVAGGSSDSTSSTGSTGSVSFADGPTYIPPLDLATARISLDLSAKTYVEQLIAYYETLALTTDRMSLSQRKLVDDGFQISQRKLVDDGFQTSKVHVD